MTTRSKTTTTTTTATNQHEKAERIAAKFRECHEFTSEEFLKYEEKIKEAEKFISRLEKKMRKFFTSGQAHATIEKIVQQHKDKNLIVVGCTTYLTNDYRKFVVCGELLPADNEDYGWVTPSKILEIPLVDLLCLLENNKVTKEVLNKYYVDAHE